MDSERLTNLENALINVFRKDPSCGASLRNQPNENFYHNFVQQSSVPCGPNHMVYRYECQHCHMNLAVTDTENHDNSSKFPCSARVVEFIACKSNLS
jgi:hypothetical protein